ncbi:AMP-binding protein [Comamonas sp. A7-5]|uniref:AMP-binding protein n=1 Tax=Comamonas sp. A7-5 TaxID=673549 RepID=UPI0031D9DF81
MTSTSLLHDNLIRRVNVGDMLLRAAERHPAKDMIVDGPRCFTYAAFNAWVNRVAHGLIAQGFQPGDRLALLSGNRAEFLVTYFACAKAGIALVPINLLWGESEIRYVQGHAKTKAVVVEQALLGKLKGALDEGCNEMPLFVIDPEVGQAPSFDTLGEGHSEGEPEVCVPNEAAITILYTSGTTSAPKGVVGSHLAITMDSLGTALDTRMTDKDRVTALLPLFHTAQLNALCTPAIAAGASIVIFRGFDAAALLDAIERERISVAFALPMMIRLLCDEQARRPRRLDSLRLTVYAMATMPRQDLLRAMELLGCEFSLMFGQTEMSPVATFFRPEHQLSHEGAVGTPATNVRVAIMDDAGHLLTAGQSGEIVYRSAQVLSEYLDNPQATADVFRHGWFHSGDAGHFDGDGVLWFDDRFKDVIKSGGENVSSVEVEKAILETEPMLAEVAVIGLPHPHWTEAITAVVKPGDGQNLDTEGLLRRLREGLSPFKCPKAVIVVPELPKTATGKIQKAQLRRTHADFYRS